MTILQSSSDTIVCSLRDFTGSVGVISLKNQINNKVTDLACTLTLMTKGLVEVTIPTIEEIEDGKYIYNIFQEDKKLTYGKLLKGDIESIQDYSPLDGVNGIIKL